MDHVKIHQPQPTTHLPAHEQAARKRRTQAEHLPAIPNRRRSAPKIQVAPGRKTTDTASPFTLYCPFAGGHRDF